VTSGYQEPGSWIELRLRSPRLVESLELHLGTRRGQPRWKPSAERLEVAVRRDGAWVLLPVVVARSEGGQWGPVQILLLDPVQASALQVRQTGSAERRWGVAELIVRALD
jgi:hypothetical protein